MKNKGQIGYVGLFFIMFIVVLVGVSLISPLAANTELAKNETGISGTPSATLLDLNTLMFALLIMGSVAGLTFLGLRAAGIL